MQILDLTDIDENKGHIFYRRTYNAIAVIEIPKQIIKVPVFFCIEVEPLGKKNVEIEFKEKLDYPLLPIIKELKDLILAKDKEGTLNC